MFTFLVYLVPIVLYMVLMILSCMREKSAINLSFFTFVFGVFLWTITLYVYFFIDTGNWLIFWGRLNYAAGIPAYFGLASFIYHFPQKSIQWDKIIIKASVLFALIVFLITLFTPFVDKSESISPLGKPVVEMGILYNFYVLSLIVFLIISVFLGLTRILELNGIEKTKLKYVFWVFIPSLSFLTLTNLVLPIFKIYLIWEYSFVIMVPVALVSFYSMQKHRFLNIPVFPLNFLREVMFFSSIILLGLIFSYFLLKVFPQKGMIINILTLVLCVYFYKKLEQYFPKFIPHNLREFKSIIAELRYKLTSCDNYQELIDALEKSFVIRLNISKAQVLLIRVKKSKIDIPICLKSSFTEYLEKNKVEILLAEEIPLLDLSEKNKKMLMKSILDFNIALCMPLYSEGKLIGLFVLGNKENNESYMGEEIRELLKLKHNLQICFMNILLKRNLKKENNLMKAMIEQKTQQIQKQYTKIKDLLKQQSSFIAVTAHEFRTPLSIALFQLQDMLEEGEDEFKEEDVRNIEKSLNSLKKLTQNLFDVQQYDLNKISLKSEKVDIVDFIQVNSEDCKKLTARKGIKCTLKNTIKTRLFCKIDKQQILQVFHNILTNAIKFTPKNGEIKIYIAQNSEGVLFKIIDNGKGISDKNKKRIFEKFQTEKLNSSTGIGLGLYICKKIIDLHKGRIWVEDTPQGGATFCVLLKHL